ncbi:MAG: hypothetical protein R3Y63_06840 [Eubacteriales bacterium]
MNYSDLLQVDPGFQTSINLEFDLNNKEKIKSYIPTTQSVNILGDCLYPIYHQSPNSRRAKVLVGPYGRGKSHLILVLSALTSLDTMVEGAESKNIQVELCEKIGRVDQTVGELAKAVVESKTRLLPVILSSNTTNFAQNLLLSMHQALEQGNLTHLLPSTHFESALDTIETWKEKFPLAMETLKKELSKGKSTPNKLITGLKQYNPKAYNQFLEIYPLISAGSPFYPLSQKNVLKVYQAVVTALCQQTEYSGIHIIFDEFSKFLEANANNSQMLQFKTIQDLAELATRSGEEQIHFTCITHKAILDYSSGDSFKGVEGRFKEVVFSDSSQESYHLISSALGKTAKFRVFRQKYNSVFRKVIESTTQLDLFQEIPAEGFEKNLLEGCFPLSPLCAFALLGVSQLVGQNERTLFTFLAQQDPLGLSAFLEKERSQADFLTLDYLYDYFEELFKREIFHERIHSIWSKTRRALGQSNTDVEVSILKAMAIILMIEDERLKTTPSHIKAALLMEEKEFQEGKGALEKKHIISQRDNTELVLLTANGVDIKKSITQYVATKVSKINSAQILSQCYPLDFVLPRAYNDQYRMMRYFPMIYMEADVFFHYETGEEILADYPYDGLIIHLISQEKISVKALNQQLKLLGNFSQIIVCTTNDPLHLETLLKDLVAIQALKKQHSASGDLHYLEELEIFQGDVLKQVVTKVDAMYAPHSPSSVFCSGNNLLPITKKTALNQAISQICQQCYPDTPIINNEMVNKNKLNAQNIKGRNLAVDWILEQNHAEIIPCMEGSGPEVSVFQSAYVATGLDRNQANPAFYLEPTLKIMQDFIQDSMKERQDFTGLYQILLAPPYGLRKGIIPLLFGFALRHYQTEAIFYFKDKEIALSATLLSAINNAPEGYQLLLEAGTQERQHFLTELDQLFPQQSRTARNPVYHIMESMQIWMRSLPEYSKHYTTEISGEPLDQSIKTLRKELLKYDVNSRDFLFETLPKLSKTKDFTEVFQEVVQIKETLDTHLARSTTALLQETTQLFQPHYEGSLSQAIITWYQSLDAHVNTGIFPVSGKTLLQFAQSLTSYDDQRTLQQLILRFEGIALEDWKDANFSSFFKKLEEAFTQITKPQAPVTASSAKGKILVQREGATLERNFSSDEISPLGEALSNNLRGSLEEFNDSISPEETIAILVQLMEEYL